MKNEHSRASSIVGTKDSLVPDIQAELKNSRDHCNTSSEINCSGSSVEDRVRSVGGWSDSGSYVSASQESSKSNTVRKMFTQTMNHGSLDPPPLPIKNMTDHFVFTSL